MSSFIRFAAGDLNRLQGEFDRFLDTFAPINGESDTESAWTPRLDLSETADAYIIETDLPGLQKDEINISFHDGTLSFSGNRKIDNEVEGNDVLRTERKSGGFYRSLTLPKKIDAGKIDATYESGVLVISVAKAEEIKPQRITVK